VAGHAFGADGRRDHGHDHSGLLVTLALGLLAVGRLNLISIAFIPLFVGLGVDFGIQICVRFAAERMRKPGHPATAPPMCGRPFRRRRRRSARR
jgi:hypothetical protein